ncbi:MAG: T9SS type A sorting domain-containing protein [Melioribacteraceae bacterium]|nr:T9SS type A sorting domain-containing protein [Melioribacteraceae bacterium]
MKKLFVVSCILFFSSHLFSQSISLPITVSNNLGKSKILNIGLDPIATDLFDLSLGEDELPPSPPEDIFDARINVYNSSMVLQGGSLIDLRNGTNTFLGEIIYYLKYQPGTGTTINIAWNLPLGVIGTLQDRVTGNLINQDMKGTGNFTISDPSTFDKLKITITYLLDNLSAPVLDAPVNNSTSQLISPTLSWNPVPFATLYKLIVATDNAFTNIVFQDSTIATTSKTVTGLQGKKQYFWKVRAKNTDAKFPITQYSPIWNFTTKSGTPASIAVLPSSISISAGSNTSVSAQLKDAWNNNSETAGVVVTWSTTNGGSFNPSTTTTDNTGKATVTFTPSITAGTVTKVKGTTDAATPLVGESDNITTLAAAASEYLVTTLNYNPDVSSVIAVSAQLSDAYNNSISTAGKVISWTSTGGGTFSSSTSNTDAAGKAVINFTVSDVVATVHTVIATDNSAPGLTGTSANITTKLIAPAKPVLVSPANNSINQSASVQLKWRKTKYAATYELLMSEASDFATSVHTKTAITDTTYTAPAMSYSKTIYWKVRAVNSSGNSVYSDPFNFRTLFSKNVTIAAGWNMVSVPVTLANMTAISIYPDKVSNVYKFSDGYLNETTLSIGIGYWVKYNIEKTINFIGSSSPTNKVAVKSGWNMIGVYDTPITVAQITTEPANSIATYFYSFTEGYIKATTLDPGKGYWIKVNADGNLVLPTGAPKNSIYAEEFDWDENAGRIIVSDSKGKNVSLSVVSSGKNLEMSELPPMPPVGIFDVRFSSNQFAEQIFPGQWQQILISNADYPITIYIDNIALRVRDSFGAERTIKKGETFVITNPAIERIEITSIEIPTDFELMQNYPNPFNPATTIKFTLPEKGRVVLSIYNVLGERVVELINKDLEAGYHEVNWNASHLSSGVYIYSLKLGEFHSIKKMILMK